MADQVHHVDSMSDAELQRKLAKHGFPVMPITASTRQLFVKKLKLVLDNKNRINKSKPRAGGNNKAESTSGKETVSSGAKLPPATGGGYTVAEALTMYENLFVCYGTDRAYFNEHGSVLSHKT